MTKKELIKYWKLEAIDPRKATEYIKKIEKENE